MATEFPLDAEKDAIFDLTAELAALDGVAGFEGAVVRRLVELFTPLADEVTEHVVRAGAAHKPLTVLGISMGAAIALRLASRKVLPIDRAVFVRPAFTAEPLPDNLSVFPVLAQLLHDHGAKSDLMESRAAFAEKRPPRFKGWDDPADRFNLPKL